MSRIGKQPVQIPSGVKVNASPDGGGTRVRVEGPKGKLDIAIRGEAKVAVEGDNVVVTRAGDTRFERSYHGTARALLANMVHGVSEGFKKSLEIIGVGYQAKLQGKTVVLNIGFCHPVELPVPEGLTIEIPNPTTVHISGPDKQVVGEFAAKIRKIRPPEPYKGKGIRYVGEYVARKTGKTFGSGD